MADVDATAAMRLSLSRPIPVGGDEVQELTFREPTAVDIIEVGNPVILDMASDPPVATHDAKRMTAMMSRLASVPPSSIARMAPNDWVSGAWLLTGFFVPGEARA